MFNHWLNLHYLANKNKNTIKKNGKYKESKKYILLDQLLSLNTI